MRTIEVPTRSGLRPSIRLRPLPAYEPPFDDEVAPELWRPSTPQPRVNLAPVPTSPSPTVARPPGATSSPVGTTADAGSAARRFVAVFVEVLNGFRPVAHLRCLTHPVDGTQILAQAMVGARRVEVLRQAAKRVAARPDPRTPCVRPGATAGRHPGPVSLRKVLLSAPRRGAVEATVLLDTGTRTWAMALRLEAHRDTWVATALRLL